MDIRHKEPRRKEEDAKSLKRGRKERLRRSIRNLRHRREER